MKCAPVLLLLLSAVLGAESDELIASPHIINGNPAYSEPHNAYILFMNDKQTGFFGGGSLISDRHILTAAQNIRGYYVWEIGLGSTTFDELTFHTSYIALTHPEYNADTRQHDIGIIFLPTPVNYQDPHILPIPLPLSGSQLPFENEQGYLVGFGFTTDQDQGPAKVLWQTFQRVTSESRCQQFFNTLAPGRFCAEAASGNVCNGDIGAGFITYDQNWTFLTGIASTIVSNCKEGSPTGYTRVSQYLDWINYIAGPYIPWGDEWKRIKAVKESITA